MKNVCALLAFLIFTINIHSQSCLPDGITFHNQLDIDSFQVNYPGCNFIEGDVYIGDYGGGSNIHNLEGLIALDSVGGSLTVRYLDSLTSLRGLENIVTVGNDLSIYQCPALTDLDGLEGITKTYYLGISSNESLTSLSGIENLVSVGYGCYISYNPSLTSLTGLEGLTSIGCGLSINSNNALLSLDGLDNLASTGCGLSIEYNLALQNIEALYHLVDISPGSGTHNITIKNNIALTSLTGLDNIDPESIGDISIGWNLALSDCDVNSICQYLSDPNGYVAIRYNAGGCNSIAEVQEDCANNCLPDGITFSTQTQIDNFQAFYPNCTEIGGDVTISGEDITNLFGLNSITEIGGNFKIHENSSLANLSGLNSLTSVHGDFWIMENESLASLSGLDGLTLVGGDLVIDRTELLENLNGINNLSSIGGDLWINSIDSLTSLAGLESITSLSGSLKIWYNLSLSSLAGLHHLNFIGDNFEILNNSSLTAFNELTALNNIGGYVDIFDNSSLQSLTGLDELESIGGDLYISRNDSLTNLSGLSNLSHIGAGLIIHRNKALASLAELENVVAIGENLWISENDSLTGLTGLDNIEAGTIDSLYIFNNHSLSECDVQSICEYLASPNGAITIENNASGCNSQAEVEAACGVGIDESVVGGRWSAVRIYPNPCSTSVTIELPKTTAVKNTKLFVYNLNGQNVYSVKITEQNTAVDISDLAGGIYFVKVLDDRSVQIGKFVKY
jgi:hypothetical protein